jgi:coenzyme F420-0:L-glutamate ligase/coenzyme F420-1:gamma-L-glutamate ligase
MNERHAAGTLGAAHLDLDLLRTRRSIRALRPDSVPRDVLEQVVEAATWAPAPHHTKPWRFALIEAPAVKESLARAMGARWSADLAGDGVPQERIARIVARSHARITGAGALVVISLVKEVLQRYPDERRQRAEHTMGAHSLGAAIENLLLAAHAAGLAGAWMCAPLFCPETVCAVLGLPRSWEPQALVTVGYPAAAAPQRATTALTDLVTWIDQVSEDHSGAVSPVQSAPEGMERG